MSDIQYSLLEEFCADKSETGWCLHAPRLIGGNVYATNRHILISVPHREISRQSMKEFKGKAPNFEAVFDKVFSLALEPLDFELPEKPDEAKLSIQCPACNGMGRFRCNCPNCVLHDHHCYKCRGGGIYKDFGSWAVELSGKQISGFHLRRIEKLPHLCWYEPAREGQKNFFDPLPFRFGGNGRGLVMPLRISEEGDV